MTCRPFTIDGVSGFVCTRGERMRRCSACGHHCALLCDGCDKPVCPTCAVGHRNEVDFCPGCAVDAWRHWCALADQTELRNLTRDERRRRFRAWARATPAEFLRLVKTSAAGAQSMAGLP